MIDRSEQFALNLAGVKQRIADAARRSGRAAESVKLVAVTKYVGVADAAELLAAGCRDLGESRPQQLWEKADSLSGSAVRWHLIGHLQRNKLRRTLPLVSMLQSLDSIRLALAIDRMAEQLGIQIPALLEVNVSGEPSKHGLDPGEIEPALVELADLERLQIRGLMAMASLVGGRQRAAADFEQMRLLRDRLSKICPPAIRLDELSMGMSRDYEEAVEQGATIVRVGSALFEGLWPVE